MSEIQPQTGRSKVRWAAALAMATLFVVGAYWFFALAWQCKATKLIQRAVELERLSDEAMDRNDDAAALALCLQSREMREQAATAICNDKSQLHLAGLYEHIGRLQHARGEFAAAVESFKCALPIRIALAAADQQNSYARERIADVHDDLGDAYFEIKDYNLALQHHEECHVLRERLFAQDSGAHQRLSKLASSNQKLGDVQLKLGNSSLAEEYFKQAMLFGERLVKGWYPTADEFDVLSLACDRLVDLRVQEGKIPEAIELYEKLASAGENVVEKLKDGPTIYSHALVYERLGNLNLRTNNLDTALGHFTKCADLCGRLQTENPSHPDWQREAMVAQERLARVLTKLGRLDEATSHYEASLAIAQQRASDQLSNAEAQHELAVLHHNLGELLVKRGQWAQAFPHCEHSLEIAERLAAVDPTNAEAQRDLMVCHYKLASLQLSQGEYAAAIDTFDAGIAVLERMIAAGQNVEASTRERQEFIDGRDECTVGQRASAPWHELLTAAGDELPNLLLARIVHFTRRADRASVIQAADHLATLEPADARNFYNAACGYGLCLKLSQGWDGRGPFPPSAAGDKSAAANDEPAPGDLDEQQGYRQKALALLQQAIAAGYSNFAHLRQDSDLAALHGDPEFEKLIPADATAPPAAGE